MEEVRTPDGPQRHALEATEREADDLLEQLRSPLGVPTQIYPGAVKVGIGEMVQVAPYDGPSVVTIQPPKSHHRGMVLGVAHVGDTTNYLLLRVAHPNGRINGAQEAVLQRRQSAILVVTEENNYIMLKGQTAGFETVLGGGGGITDHIVNYLDKSMPIGYSAPALAVFQPDNTADDLKDRTNNGHDLTWNGGNGAPHRTIRHGLQGWSFRIGNQWARTAVDSNLVSLGAATFEGIIAGASYTDVDDMLFGVHGDPASELEAENYTFALKSSNTGGEFYSFHEHGAGVNDLLTLDNVVPSRGGLHYVCQTRAADGKTTELYIDAVLMGSGVAGNAPTGGANARIWAAGFDSVSDWRGDIHGMRWSHGHMTPAQISEVNTRLRTV